MAALTENNIIDNAFYLLEKDSTPWATTDDEYSTARGILNIGVGRWENYENTTWRELWTKLSKATTGQDTVSSGVWTYNTPDDFIRPGGYITTTASDGSVTFWKVVPPEQVTDYSDSTADVCWFDGNQKAGFDLNFNAKTTPNNGATINYPYYKRATRSSNASTVLEVGDPNFLSYFIAAHMSESADSVEGNFFTIAEGLLKQMKSVNNSGIWSIPSNIDPSLEDWQGFGTGSNGSVSSSNPTGR
jgi:hypothetical protein